MTTIHPTAVVDPRAELGQNVRVGPYSIVSEDVRIGDDTEIGPHVVIDRWTTLGRGNRVFAGAVIGSQSQDLKYKGAPTYCVVGDHNVIREYVTVNRATIPGARTVIGSHNALLAYSHVAHDCVIGDRVTISNVTTLAGHVRVEDGAGLGGYVGVHQFCRIGRLAFVGGWSKLVQDVPPFVRVSGAPLKVYGLNSVGLERNGIGAGVRRCLMAAYRLLYRSNLNVSRAIETIRAEVEQCPEICQLIEFVERSERGICRRLDDDRSEDPCEQASNGVGFDDGPGDDGPHD